MSLTKFQTLASGFVLLASVVGTPVALLNFADTRYAMAEDLTTVKDSIEEVAATVRLHELEDLYNKALDEVFRLRAMARKYPGDPDLPLDLKRAEEDKEMLKHQIQALKINKEK